MLLVKYEDATLIRCHPHSAHLILKNIISPGSRILAGLVIDDEVEQLSRTLLIEVDAVVCTDPYIPLLVFINLAHTVVS